MEILIIIILLLLLIKTSNKSNHRNTNSKTKHIKSTTPEIEWKWDSNKNGKNCGIEDIPDLQNAINIEKEDISEIDFKKSYQARYLLTKNEWHEFKKLQSIADTKGYIICPKVRLLDIIEPIKGQKKYMTLFYKVQAKHVDFVICDKDVHIKAIIELDDASHNREDRMERDHFVDEILKSVGYTVIHTKTILNDILDLV